MINKYSGVTLVVIAILSLFASWTIYKKYTKNFYAPQNKTVDSRKLINDIQIKKEAFTSLKVMNEVIDKLGQSRESTDKNISIALAPYKNIDERPVIEQPTDLEKKKKFAANICRQARRLDVSMSFVADEDSYAVISDKFVRVGQKVANKFKVTGIKPEKITVKKSGIYCTVKVAS